MYTTVFSYLRQHQILQRMRRKSRWFYCKEPTMHLRSHASWLCISLEAAYCLRGGDYGAICIHFFSLLTNLILACLSTLFIPLKLTEILQESSRYCLHSEFTKHSKRRKGSPHHCILVAHLTFQPTHVNSSKSRTNCASREQTPGSPSLASSSMSLSGQHLSCSVRNTS